MNAPSPEENRTGPDARLPRAALVVVAVGLIATIGAIVLSESGGSSSEREWDAVERVDTPPARQLGPRGSLRVAGTTVSALAPRPDHGLIFQVAGVAMIDSGGSARTTLRCDVSAAAASSSIARTASKRAAWPRPSEDLLRQEVPERAVVAFRLGGNELIGMPIRDSFRRYTDSAMPVTVDWPGFQERSQGWVWKLPRGTGEGPATLGWAVSFRTEQRPRAQILCRARTKPASGRGSAAAVKIPVRLQQWPIPDSDSDTAAAGASNVE